jgi:hypothetical protein
MGWIERYIQSPPADPRPVVAREPVSGAVCPECGSDDVRRYPIANQYGPRMAVKCQACLHILATERCTVEDNWPPFRSVTWDWDPSISERASRELLERGITLDTGGDPAATLSHGS